jgi:peptide/nickel transport system substrate-binding protein
VKLKLCVLFTAVALVVTACGGQTTTAPAAQPTTAPAAPATNATAAPDTAPTTPAPAPAAAGKVLRVGAPADTYRNDPADMGRVTIAMSPVNTNVFDQLTLMDANFNVKPMLAESWEYLADTKTWRFKLRQGVTFHNGTPFTAAAVVETMQRHANGPGANQLRIDENSTKAVDDFTVDITPTTPNFALPAQLVHPQFGMHAPGVNLTEQQIGTGPFKMVEYVKGQRIVVERNPDYWGQKAAVERIEFRFFPDPQARILALQAGEVDVIYDVAPESAKVLQDEGRFTVVAGEMSASQYLMLMLSGEGQYTLGKELAVRQALGYAINREEIVATAFDGFAINTQTFVPPGVLGESASKIKGFSYDPEKAKTLLEEAGWVDGDGDGIREKDGKPLRLELINGFPSAAENSSTAEVLQAQARDVGIDLQIVATPDNPAYEQRLKDKQGDIYLEIGNQNSAATCFLLNLYYGRSPSPGNYQVAFAPALIGINSYDDAVDTCNGTPNLAEAQAAAAEAIRISIEEVAVNIPLVGIQRIWAASDTVQNFTPHPVRIHVRWEGVSVTQ